MYGGLPMRLFVNLNDATDAICANKSRHNRALISPSFTWEIIWNFYFLKSDFQVLIDNLKAVLNDEGVAFMRYHACQAAFFFLN